MRRIAVRCLTPLFAATILVSCGLCATAWKLVLKDGNTIECDGAPIVINDVYLFRSADGKDGTLDADQVDRERTERTNKVAPAPRQWRMIGESVREPSAGGNGSVLTLSDADFGSVVLNSKTPVLVEFWTTWCGYCRKMAPAMEAIAAEHAGSLRVGKVDLDKNPALASRYRITAIPTLMLFRQGRVAGTVTGYAEKAEMLHMLRARQ